MTAEEDEPEDEAPAPKAPPAKAPLRGRAAPPRPARPVRPIAPVEDDDEEEADEKPSPRRGGRVESRPQAPAAPSKGRAMGADARQGDERPRRGSERSATRGVRQTGSRELTPFVEKGYELVHLPDGTLVRSEMAKKNRRGDGGRRRPTHPDDGPGPALFGYDEVPYQPTEPKSSPRTPSRERQVAVGAHATRCRRSVNYLKRRLPLIPRVAVILGSGLSSVADLSGSDDVIDFADIPDFPTPTAPGHDGIIRVGAVEGTPTLFCEGRIHYYENGSMADTVFPVQTLLALGVEHFILTTSAGALNPSFRTGDIMFIKDQINLTGDNPFFAAQEPDGPSFVDTTRIYDSGMIGMGERLCRRARVTGRQGVLAVTRGPVYETPAERKMLAAFGADAVSMSVAAEAMVLAQAHATVVGLAVIVNEAAAATRRPVTHDEVLASGQKGAMGLSRLITAIIGQGW
ncbi:MAG: purine-nucleoside phosphorylase [Nitrospinae bacterium]|nr:purine-nucleoside phosphorylase [Nitrospinota bacterium]